MTTPAKDAGVPSEKGPGPAVESPLRRFISDFCESRVALSGLAVFGCIVFVAIFAPYISPQDPYDLAQLDILDGRLEPGAKNMMGDTYWLGTDDQGRDMLSGIFYGLRTSLGVGAMSALLALMFGGTMGLVAAYFGGRTDTLIMRVVDIQLSFPSILIALVLLAILGQGVDKIIIALVAAQWAYYARTIRGTALVERRKEYIEAAACLALSHRHDRVPATSAQLPAAADRGGYRAGGPRHRTGGDAFFFGDRIADYRTDPWDCSSPTGLNTC